jgi:hypothetical protein
MKKLFQLGNKAAERWTEIKAISVLTHILSNLWMDEKTGKQGANPVRANRIKLRKEACMIGGITERQWAHIKTKFTNKNSRYFSEQVFTLVLKLEETCECRLAYSGTAMDIFLLKTHYGYSDNAFTRHPKVFLPVWVSGGNWGQ